MECVNLKERFGKRYRIRYEESYQADRGNKAWGDDPWLQIIPCRHGHIYPHGDNLLGASTDKRGAIARKLAALPETTIYQDGDDGLTVLFDAADFGKVAAVMLPRRRRRLSEAARAKLMEAGAKTRFQRGVQPQNTNHTGVPAA